MIVVELVPRAMPVFVQDAQDVLAFPDVAGINVPDIDRLEIRSDEAVSVLLAQSVMGIPHLRVGGGRVAACYEKVAFLVDQGLERVLLVSGDNDESVSIKDRSVIKAILLIKKRFPSLHIYAAVDPYRQSIKTEMAYVKAKYESGVDGFFTQPFFDEALASVYIDRLPGSVFLGVSPVCTEASYRYWQDRNAVVFPSSFSLAFEDQVQLGRRLIALSKRASQHVYLMPIRLPVLAYVSAVLET